MDISEQATYCPYCGESISVLIDTSLSEQNYIEDCEVCCKPIIINVSVISEDDIMLDVKSEND